MSRDQSPMSSAPSGHRSSGRSLDVDDERRQKRKLSNRESARRSRMRKQQHLQDLMTQAARLARENREMAAHAEALAQSHRRMEEENGELRTRAAELAERLRSLSSVLRCVEKLSGAAMDLPVIPGPPLKQWQRQLLAAALPVSAAAADVFKC